MTRDMPFLFFSAYDHNGAERRALAFMRKSGVGAVGGRARASAGPDIGGDAREGQMGNARYMSPVEVGLPIEYRTPAAVPTAITVIPSPAVGDGAGAPDPRG